MALSDRQNLADTLFHDLCLQILSGQLAPGERLPPERTLAQRYETNRNTLREAVRKLEQLHLVSVRHGAGVTVRDFRSDATLEILPHFLLHASRPEERGRVLEDVLGARVQILEMALTLACARRTEDDLARLRELAALQAERLEAGDRDALIRGELDTLDALIDAAHSLVVRWSANTLLAVYRDVLQRFPELWIMEPTIPEYLRAICDAIEAQQPDDARIALHRFIERADAKLRALFA